jgi:RHS repeat-associated protein
MGSFADGWSSASRYKGVSYTLTYDAENRLISVSGGGLSASFVYDGDGNRVKGVVGALTTTYIGNYFEWTGSTDTMKRYYYAGSVRVAMKTGGSPDQNPVLNWLFGDHLGSTSRAANANGAALTDGDLRYKAWGEKRFPADSSAVPTTYRYTGQRQEAVLGGVDGLYFYNSRWYDPYLNRWIQPDTLVPSPGDPRAWDRFAYVLNNPLKYIDPSGHRNCEEDGYNCWPGDSGGNNRGGNTGGTLRPVPVVIIKYKKDTRGEIRYDREETWQNIPTWDLLARYLISEQMSGILNPGTSIDAVGVAWVIRNRWNDSEFFEGYGGVLDRVGKDPAILRKIILAGGGLSGAYKTGCGDPCPGNAAYAANPEAYPKQFGGHPKEIYWTAVSIAHGVLSGSIPDPTKGATYFSDAMIISDDKTVPWPDGRTHFGQGGTARYSIPELNLMPSPPW